MKILLFVLLFFYPVGDPTQLAKMAEDFSNRVEIVYKQAIEHKLDQTFTTILFDMSMEAEDLRFTADMLSIPQSKNNDLKLRKFAQYKISLLKIGTKHIRNLSLNEAESVIKNLITNDAEKLVKEFEKHLLH